MIQRLCQHRQLMRRVTCVKWVKMGSEEEEQSTISSSSLFLLLLLGGSLSFSGREGLLQSCSLFLESRRS